MSAFAGGLDAARRVLGERFGHSRFRVHQLRVLGPLLAGRNVLAVLPTGAGKSLCYQVPALLANGLIVVVSPLISLMQDQVAGLRRRGIAAAYLNSQLDAGQRRTILDATLAGRVTLLYCAPERLPSLTRQLRAAATPIALLAIDEAHCITEWGNEFRPVYRRLGVLRAQLGHPLTIALTGSATPAARADILTTTSAWGMRKSSSPRSTGPISHLSPSACGTIASGFGGCGRCCASPRARREPRWFTRTRGASPSS